MDAQFGFPEAYSSSEDGDELLGAGIVDGQSNRQSLLMRIVVKVSRARWFAFLRRVFLYQNGVRRELGSNPLNSGFWIGLEALILVAQIITITVTVAMSKEEKPVWPLRAWALGYDLASILGLPLLVWRYGHSNVDQENGRNDLDVEQQGITEESRTSNVMSRIQTSLELFFAIWFVVGNLWVFDGTRDSFQRSPKLIKLCIGLLAWNALSYSLPFILFVLLCFCVPFIHSTLGYNMNMVHRGASEEQISRLPVWKFNEISLSSNDSDEDCAEKLSTGRHPKDTESECCICLVTYKDKEEVRELPCSHIFHLSCIDKWLRIISSCPLCKQHLHG